MMEAPFTFLMSLRRGFVAVKTCLLLHFFSFQRRLLPPQGGLIVFGGLEGEAPTLISHSGRFIDHLPVGSDRQSVALVAATGRGDTFQGVGQGAAADRDNKSGK